MNVRPGITSHLKFTRFKRRIGEQCSLEYIIDLFAHCQANYRGENWGKVSNDYVEDVCRWEGPPGALYEALAAKFEEKPGWVHRNEQGELVVTGWNDENKWFIRNWLASPNCADAARIKFWAYHSEKQREMHKRLLPHLPKHVLTGVPKEVPRELLTEVPPDVRSDPIGSDLIGSHSTGGGEPAPSLDSEPPFEWEILKIAATARIPADYAARYWRRKMEKTASWFDQKTGQRINLAQQLLNYWIEDKADWEKDALKNGAGGLSVEQQLAAETDPEKRRLLREQMRAAA